MSNTIALIEQIRNNSFFSMHEVIFTQNLANQNPELTLAQMITEFQKDPQYHLSNAFIECLKYCHVHILGNRADDSGTLNDIFKSQFFLREVANYLVDEFVDARGHQHLLKLQVNDIEQLVDGCITLTYELKNPHALPSILSPGGHVVTDNRVELLSSQNNPLDFEAGLLRVLVDIIQDRNHPEHLSAHCQRRSLSDKEKGLGYQACLHYYQGQIAKLGYTFDLKKKQPIQFNLLCAQDLMRATLLDYLETLQLDLHEDKRGCLDQGIAQLAEKLNHIIKPFDISYSSLLKNEVSEILINVLKEVNFHRNPFFQFFKCLGQIYLPRSQKLINRESLAFRNIQNIKPANDRFKIDVNLTEDDMSCICTMQ